MSIEQGALYVVATPIGNLEDISRRALEVLAGVDRIAVEDTRRSRRLLGHYGIARPLVCVHEHNERRILDRLLAALGAGESLALISDAGTPLISDPGYHLVRRAREAGIRVIPVPGASALVSALSVSGLPTDRFVFEGFLPARAAARRARLEQLADEGRTLVFYEAAHRIADSLADLAAVFGPGREAVLARELTKAFETVRGAPLEALHGWVCADADQRKGEFVLVVAGAPAPDAARLSARDEQVLGMLLEVLPAGQAATLAGRITGARRKLFYRKTLELKGED